MILLTIRDLQHRALRFVVVIVLASVVFALLFLMSGLVEQFNREPFAAVDAFGAEGWVVTDGISGPFTAGSTLSGASVAAVDADLAVPAVVARSSIRTGGESEGVILIGHVVDSMGSPPTVVGRAVQASGELVVDRSVGASVGDQVEVAGLGYEVVGLSDDTTMLAGIPLVFMKLEDAQQIVFQTDQVVSAVLVSGEVRAVPPGAVNMSSAMVAQDALKPLEGAVSTVDLLRVLLWLVAAVIIGAVVYLSALDRLRDFAVLKAIGATNRGLMGGLAIQAVVVAVTAVLLAGVIQLFLVPVFPLKITVPARAFLQIPLVAVVLALIAGAAGMRKVAASDPALAFSGAGG